MTPRVEAAYRRTFAALRGSRNFRLYLAGQFISAVGTWMNFTASSWLVLKLAGNGTALGVVITLQFLPLLPGWLVPQDRQAIQDFFSGNSTLYTWRHLRAWAGPKAR